MYKFRRIIIAMLFLLISMISGVYATWQFSEGDAETDAKGMDVTMNEFTFAPPKILYIQEMTLMSVHSVSNLRTSFTRPTYIDCVVDSLDVNATVTYKVTLYNNTDVVYWYLGASWKDNVGSNALIDEARGITILVKDHYDDTSSTFDTEDWVPPQTTRDIYVTYRYGANAVASDVHTLLSLDFGMKMDSVHDSFEKILNDTQSQNGYTYLEQVFNERYAQTGSTVIGNVGADKAIFDKIFGGAPTIKIDGKDVPVTIMLQRQNVDDRTTGDNYSGTNAPKGCEYTLYITIDPLDSPTGEAMVYAVSYSRGGEGDTDDWYQLGELYEGKAPLTTYDSQGNVAFDVEAWRATANQYEFIDGYYYKVGYEQGDQYAKYKTIEELMSANDQNFYNDIDNSQLLRKVYAVVYDQLNVNKPGHAALKSAFEIASPFYNIHNNGQEVKIKREATRAELLPYIESIQKAYTYYQQVNG